MAMKDNILLLLIVRDKKPKGSNDTAYHKTEKHILSVHKYILRRNIDYVFIPFEMYENILITLDITDMWKNIPQTQTPPTPSNATMQ